jgi:hypothetical protein
VPMGFPPPLVRAVRPENLEHVKMRDAVPVGPPVAIEGPQNLLVGGLAVLEKRHGRVPVCAANAKYEPRCPAHARAAVTNASSRRSPSFSASWTPKVSSIRFTALKVNAR